MRSNFTSLIFCRIPIALLLSAHTAFAAIGIDYEPVRSFGFPETSGALPQGNIMQASDGAFYGTTERGGRNGLGVVYRLSADRTEYQVLHHFTRVGDVEYPQSPLIESSDGYLYGTAPRVPGGIFKISKDGSEYEVWQEFPEASVDRMSPLGPLLEGSDGMLYGAVPIGSSSELAGVNICRFNRDGNGFESLHRFPYNDQTAIVEDDGRGNEAYDSGGVHLIEASNGMLYGTTTKGGMYGRGILFRLNRDGTNYEILRDFNNPAIRDAGFFEAEHPMDLIEGSDGRIYGIALDSRNSSTSGQGCAWRSNLNGTDYEVTLTGLELGNLHTTLVKAGNGRLYVNEYEGIRSFAKDGSSPVMVHVFTREERRSGRYPVGIIETDSGTLLGVTEHGGGSGGGGVIFEMNRDGTDYRTQWKFYGKGNDGTHPFGGLTVGSDGALYGVTYMGGTTWGSAGVVFRLQTTGEYDVIRSLSTSDSEPRVRGPILQASDGDFYTVASREGGAAGIQVFRVSPDGTELQRIVHDSVHYLMRFYGGLIQASDGLLYGTSLIDDYDRENGIIYRVNPADGTWETFHEINGHALVGLTEASDGFLYGTYLRSWGRSGVLFRIGLDGSGYFALHDFADTAETAVHPRSRVIEGSDGKLYGTTERALYRVNRDGTGFEVLRQMAPWSRHSSLYEGPLPPLVEGDDGYLYSTWSGRDDDQFIYRIQKDGQGFERVYQFHGTRSELYSEPINEEGYFPLGRLVKAPDGWWYGTTFEGGLNRAGTIYRFQVGIVPEVVAGPEAQLVPQGEDAVLSVEATTGEASLAYQWYRDQGDGWQTIDGAVESTLVLSDFGPEDEGRYRVHVSNRFGEVEAEAPVGLVRSLAHRYSFDETPGTTTVLDSIGEADGEVIGNADFDGAGRLALSGGSPGGYVNLPNGIISNLEDATFEGWVIWEGNQDNVRIFDFGNNTEGEDGWGAGTSYMYLLPREKTEEVARFAIRLDPDFTYQTAPEAFPQGELVHFAVSYNVEAGHAKLFMNGQLVDVGEAIIPLSGIDDVNNWLGKANWENSPFFQGKYEEFRIYSEALSEAAVSASYVAGPNAELELPAEDPPTIVDQPESITAEEGQTVIIAFEVNGTEPIVYSWAFNGEPLAADAPSLTLEGVTTADAGEYVLTAENAAGSTSSPPIMLSVNPAPRAITLDVDGNGHVDLLTDGIMIARGMFDGFSPEVIVAGAIDPDGARTSPAEVRAFLDELLPKLDVDDNGEVDGLTDGILTARYIVGFGGDTLVNGALGGGAQRVTSDDIIAYLDLFALDSTSNMGKLHASRQLMATEQKLQVARAVPSQQTVAPGEEVVLTVEYTTEPLNEAMTGLGLRIHFDSTQLAWSGLSEVLGKSLLAQGEDPMADQENFDNDPATDRYVQVAWLDFGGEWPGEGTLPAQLYQVRFVTQPEFTGTTTVGFSASSTAAEYELAAEPAVVEADGAVSEPPEIVVQPQDVSVLMGQPITLSITASGTELTYQWRKDGVEIEGETGAVLLVASASLDNSGTYDVVVSNGQDEVTSAGATVTVNEVTEQKLQVVRAVPSQQTVAPSEEVMLTVEYTTEPLDEAVTGLGLRIHFDSTQLAWGGLNDVLEKSLLAQGEEPVADEQDLDNEPATDRYVQVAWLDFGGGWPGEGTLPAQLYQARFVAQPEFTGTTTVGFSTSSTAAEYALAAETAIVEVDEGKNMSDPVLSISQTAENEIHVQVSGPVGVAVRLLESSDLVNWEDVGEMANEDGVVKLTLPAEAARSFWKVVVDVEESQPQ